MHYMLWVICGFALLFFSNFLGALGDLGATRAERLPFNITALLVLLFALGCFFKGIRGASKAMTGGASTNSEAASPVRKTTPLRTETVGHAGDFDPDAALANYMKRRGNAESSPAPVGEPVSPRAAGFGRKRS